MLLRDMLLDLRKENYGHILPCYRHAGHMDKNIISFVGLSKEDIAFLCPLYFFFISMIWRMV